MSLDEQLQTGPDLKTSANAGIPILTFNRMHNVGGDTTYRNSLTTLDNPDQIIVKHTIPGAGQKGEDRFLITRFYQRANTLGALAPVTMNLTVKIGRLSGTLVAGTMPVAHEVQRFVSLVNQRIEDSSWGSGTDGTYATSFLTEILNGEL